MKNIVSEITSQKKQLNIVLNTLRKSDKKMKG